jgi:hypothetical protein
MHASDGTDRAVPDLGGSGDDRLLMRERVSARRCCRRWRMPSRQTTAQQTTGRSAWTCLNDSVPPADCVPALEVQSASGYPAPRFQMQTQIMRGYPAPDQRPGGV